MAASSARMPIPPGSAIRATPRDFVVGRSLEEILPPEQAEFATMQYRRAIETREPVEYQYTAQFPVGEVSRRSFLVPLPGASGRIEHVLLAAVDLTEMRRVEAQLRQAQKMEAIGQLTGGIAHDFNNLLTAVIGNLELLQRRLTDQRSLSLADAAMRSALRGGQLTQQLLAYARRQNLSPRPVDVNAVITGMGDLLQRSLGGLVQVETDLAADLWPATSDPTQLELVVLNLAINSRDAMPHGGRLRIVTSNVHHPEVAGFDALDPGDYVRIAVIDTGDRHVTRGPGARIRAVLHHQGDRQGQRSRARAGLWRGHAVRRHGADCQRTRRRHDGGGTSCRAPWRTRAPSPCAEPHAADMQGDGGTVLVVDDDPEVREHRRNLPARSGLFRQGGRQRTRSARYRRSRSDLAWPSSITQCR